MALTKTDHVTETEYRRLALGNTQLELYRGQLREKPGMSVAHGRAMQRLLEQLLTQLDSNAYVLRTQHARLRVSADTYYVPDIAVIPAAAEEALYANPRSLDAYPAPLPLVVEVWSPSTGDYDIKEKLPGYQHRGDREIWYVHPYDKALTAWRRQADGTYEETVYREGVVTLVALPA